MRRALWAAALLLAGCLRLSGFHPKCDVDTDCPSGEVCMRGQCRAPCQALYECEPGMACRDGHCEDACSSDLGCPKDQICTLGKCVAGCRLTSVCPPTMGCIDDVCQPAQRCQMNSECMYPQRCIDNICVNEPCDSFHPCPFELECQGARCVMPSSPTQSACGHPGQPCCAGFQCTNGCCARGAGGSFACVGIGAACGDTVDQSLCEAGGACATCGGLGRPCCASPDAKTWCSAGNTACETATQLCRPCGNENQPCCGADSSSFGMAAGGCTGAGLGCRDNGLGYFRCMK